MKRSHEDGGDEDGGDENGGDEYGGDEYGGDEARAKKTKRNEKLTYLGSCKSSEGLRDYYKIVSVIGTYKTLLGDKNEFGVYTSTGINTKGICSSISPTPCIIPFFGVMTNLYDDKNPIIAPLIKTDYVTNSPYFKHPYFYSKFKDKVLYDPSTIANNKLREYFNNTQISDANLLSYKKKLGHSFFFDNIVNYKQDIIDDIEFRTHQHERKEYSNLTFINAKLKDNNIFGIDLSKLRKFNSYLIESNNYLTLFRHHPCNITNEKINELLQKFKRMSPHPPVYHEINESPIEQDIYDTIFFMGQYGGKSNDIFQKYKKYKLKYLKTKD
jgi:hypothetical protein